MLKLTGITKTIPFEFTDFDGSAHNLEVTEFTVGDIKNVVSIQQPVLEDKEMDVVDQSEIIVLSRIVCSIKVQGTDVPFWSSIEDFKSKNYPNNLVNELYPLVNKLNPVVAAEDFDEKKKRILSDGYDLLIKRICQYLRRPVFEVMQYPASELEYWSLYFSIDDNQDKPIIKQESVSVEASKKAFRKLWS